MSLEENEPGSAEPNVPEGVNGNMETEASAGDTQTKDIGEVNMEVDIVIDEINYFLKDGHEEAVVEDGKVIEKADYTFMEAEPEEKICEKGESTAVKAVQQEATSDKEECTVVKQAPT